MQRYFVPKENWQEKKVIISGDDYHHIVRVMRMRQGESLLAVNPEGETAEAIVESFTDDQVLCSIKRWIQQEVELPIQVTIAQGIPKGEKWEWILQKGTELGANAFLSFQAERSVVKWEERKHVKKMTRWEKIVKEASEQSHRTVIPTIDWVQNWRSFLEDSQTFDYRLFAYEEEAKQTPSVKLHSIFQSIHSGASVLICIGPEGGFSTKEANDLKQHDFQAIRLGPRILRTETAPLYVLASLSYYFEEMR